MEHSTTSEETIQDVFLQGYISTNDLFMIIKRKQQGEKIITDIKNRKLKGKRLGKDKVIVEALGSVVELLTENEINQIFVLALKKGHEENLEYLENNGIITDDKIYEMYLKDPTILENLKQRYGEERIAKLTSTEKVIDLYRKKYHEKNDKGHEYEKNIKLYQMNPEKNDDDVILGLEKE